MPGRRRSCSSCGETWRGEDARFCGSCGGAIDDAAAPPAGNQDRRGRPTLGHVAAIAGLAAVVGAGVVASGTDLPRPGGGPDDTVDLDEDAPTADTPLSEDDADRLLADAAALRCEPRGCELWRLNVRDRSAGDGMAGVAQIGDVVLLPTGRDAGARADDGATDAGPDDGAPDGDADATDEGGVAPPSGGGTTFRFTAVDIHTGEPRWEHDVAAGVSGVRVLSAGGLGVLVTGSTITALDEDGEVRWEWDHRGGGDDAAQQSIQGIEHDDDRLVFAAHRTGASGGAALVAVDLATGELLWQHEQLLAAIAWPDVVAEVDRDGRLRRLELATGEARWEATGGPFDDVTIAAAHIVGHGQDGQLSVHALDDGDTVIELDEIMAAGPMSVDDGFVAVVLPDSDPRDIDAGMFTPSADDPAIEVVRIGFDGTERWRTALPLDRTPTSCCGVHGTTNDEIVVTVDGERHHLDPVDGALLDPGGVSAESLGGEAEGTWFTAPSGLEMRTGAQGQRVDLRTPDGAEARISSDQRVHLLSEDPLVATDGETFLGVELVGDDGGEGG